MIDSSQSGKGPSEINPFFETNPPQAWSLRFLSVSHFGFGTPLTFDNNFSSSSSLKKFGMYLMLLGP